MATLAGIGVKFVLVVLTYLCDHVPAAPYEEETYTLPYTSETD
jgi:hypothetical protein